MPSDIIRGATAQWNGSLKDGNGAITTGGGALKDMSYTRASRFEDGTGTNPEELLGAAHAACYSMALGAGLGRQGFEVEYVRTTADVVLTPQQPSGFKITKIKLTTRAKVPGVDAAAFQEAAENTKKSCIISQALSAIEMELDAALE
jgi:lipoyl-dependent peroxiredoxin